MLYNEEFSRLPARDLADTSHSRRSLRASLERRARLARRRRATSGGRRAVVVATCLLAVGGGAAFAQGTGGSAAGSRAARAVAPALPGGVDVTAVQRRLGVTADGVAGPRTRAAVKRFQRRHGLRVDGVLGPATLRALGVRAKEASVSGAATSALGARLSRIALCESGGNPTAVSPSGRYRGKYQFSRATWRALGGSGDPAAASEGEQDLRAAALMQRQGPSAWPVCSRG